jgi:hypothetical protein
MRLENRQVRFIVPFLSLRPRQIVKLGGRRGSLHLQETALVVEGELLCFSFILGLEWLFRRALSQWTTLTIPYSRIERVHVTSLWPLRLGTLLFTAAWVALMFWTWDNNEVIPLVMVIGAAIVMVLGYMNLRLRRVVSIRFCSKDRRRMLAMVLRPKAMRSAFLDMLNKHRSMAQKFQTTTLTQNGAPATR